MLGGGGVAVLHGAIQSALAAAIGDLDLLVEEELRRALFELPDLPWRWVGLLLGPLEYDAPLGKTKYAVTRRITLAAGHRKRDLEACARSLAPGRMTSVYWLRRNGRDVLPGSTACN